MIIVRPQGYLARVYRFVAALHGVLSSMPPDKMNVPKVWKEACRRALYSSETCTGTELLVSLPELRPYARELSLTNLTLGGRPVFAAQGDDPAPSFSLGEDLFIPDVVYAALWRPRCPNVDPIFHADFEADVVGEFPNVSPPGWPEGDEISYIQDVSASSVSPPEGIKVVDTDGRRCLYVGIPGRPDAPPVSSSTVIFRPTSLPLVTGSICMEWLAKVRPGDYGHVSIRAVSHTFGPGPPVISVNAFSANAEYSTEGTLTKVDVGGRWHRVVLQLCMESKVVSVTVDGMPLLEQAFDGSLFPDFSQLIVSYTPEMGEVDSGATTMAYYMDDVRISTSTFGSGYNDPTPPDAASLDISRLEGEALIPVAEGISTISASEPEEFLVTYGGYDEQGIKSVQLDYGYFENGVVHKTQGLYLYIGEENSCWGLDLISGQWLFSASPGAVWALRAVAVNWAGGTTYSRSVFIDGSQPYYDIKYYAPTEVKGSWTW